MLTAARRAAREIIAAMAEPAPPPWYCVECGVKLLADHDYCWSCGAVRWRPDGDGGAPPLPAAEPAPSRLGSLQFYFAFWAVALLVWAAVDFGVLAAADVTGVPVVGQLAMISIKVLGAALHGAAYYGIRARRVHGWLLGVVLAGLWSLILVGIPALALLLRRSTREAFGLA